MGLLLRFTLGFIAYMLAAGAVTWCLLPLAESLDANIAILFAAMSSGGLLYLYQREKKRTA